MARTEISRFHPHVWPGLARRARLRSVPSCRSDRIATTSEYSLADASVADLSNLKGFALTPTRQKF